jgi:hypothetical protein
VVKECVFARLKIFYKGDHVKWAIEWYDYWMLSSFKTCILGGGGWARLSPLVTTATIWPSVSSPDDRCDVCEAVGGMRIGKGNRSTRKKKPAQCHLVHHKLHMTWPGFGPGPQLWEPGDWPSELWHDLNVPLLLDHSV